MAMRNTMLRMFLAGLLLLFMSVNGHVVAPARAATQGVTCGASAQYDASTNGTSLLITNTTGMQTYICGFVIFAGGTANVKLTYGTGSTCTGAHAITPAFQLTAQTGLLDASAQWRGLPVAPLNNNVCIVTSAGVAVQAIVFYSPAP